MWENLYNHQQAINIIFEEDNKKKEKQIKKLEDLVRQLKVDALRPQISPAYRTRNSVGTHTIRQILNELEETNGK